MRAPFALTVDVEEYFHVQAFAALVPMAAWEDFPARVVDPTCRILDLLAARGARATFFVLGRVARRHPALIRRIAGEGHEIASHGFHHQLVYRQSPATFRADVRDSRALLEDISGMPIVGYRAPNFSINRHTAWAYPVLAEEGFRYSSSSHPVLNDRYGSLRGLRRPSVHAGILEVPVVTARLFGINWPCGGGGYLRLLPFSWTRAALMRASGAANYPLVFYVHPWELDPSQPRPCGLPWTTRWRHYHNLALTANRLQVILTHFGSERLDRLLGFVPAAACARAVA